MSSLKKRFLSGLLAAVMLAGIAVSAGAEESGWLEGSGLPEQTTEAVEGTMEPDADPAVFEAPEEGGEAAARQSTEGLLNGGGGAFSVVEKDDLLFLEAKLDLREQELLTGAVSTGYVYVTPKVNATYQQLVFRLKAEGGVVISPASGYPNITANDEGDGEWTFTLNSLALNAGGGLLTALVFNYSFPNGTTLPGDNIASISIEAISCGGASVTKDEIDANAGRSTLTLSPRAGAAWDLKSLATPTAVSLAADVEKEAGTNSINLGTARIPTISTGAVAAANTNGFLNAKEVSVSASLVYQNGFYLTQATIEALPAAGGSFTIEKSKSEPKGGLTFMNSNAYPITVHIVAISEDRLDLRFEAGEGVTATFNMGIGHTAIGYQGELTEATILLSTVYAQLTVDPDNSYAVLLDDSEARFTTGKTVDYTLTKPTGIDRSQYIQAYVDGIQKVWTPSYISFADYVFSENTFYGLPLYSYETYIARNYLMEDGAHPYDPYVNTGWFKITGIRNTSNSADISYLSIHDTTADDLEVLGFQPAVFNATNKPEQKIYLVLADGQEILLYHTDAKGVIDFDSNWVEDHTRSTYDPVKNSSKLTYIYLLNNVYAGATLRFEFEGAVRTTNMTSEPHVLMQVGPAAEAKLAASETGQVTLTNTLEIVAIDSGNREAKAEATATVPLRGDLNEEVSINKTMENITRQGDWDTNLRPGDEVEFTVTYGLKEGTDFIQAVVLVDELLANLTTAQSMTATIEVSTQNGSTLAPAWKYHGYGYSETHADSVRYIDVIPVTGTGSGYSYKDTQMAYYLEGLLVRGDTVTITYRAFVADTIDPEKPYIHNVVYANTHATKQQGTLEPWVPGSGAEYVGEYQNNIVGAMQYGAVDLWLENEKGEQITATDREATFVVQGGMLFSEVGTTGPTFVVQAPAASSRGFQLPETIEAWLLDTDAQGQPVEDSKTLIPASSYTVTYYSTNSTNPTVTVPGTNALYMVVNFDGQPLAPGQVIRFAGAVKPARLITYTTAAYQYLVYMATGLAADGVTRYGDQPQPITSGPWGKGTTQPSPVAGVTNLFKKDLAAGQAVANGYTYLQAQKNFVTQVGQDYLYMSKSASPSVTVATGTNVTYSLTTYNAASQAFESVIEVTHLVDVLPLGMEYSGTNYVRYGTSSSNANFNLTLGEDYKIETDWLEDGRQRLIYRFTEPLELNSKTGETKRWLWINYTVTSGHYAFEGDTLVDQNRYTVYLKAPAEEVMVNTSAYYTLADRAAETDEDYATWWQGIEGLDAHNSRVTYRLAVTQRKPQIRPGVVTTGDTTKTNLQGGALTRWQFTLSQDSSSSYVDGPMQDYTFAYVLPNGFSYVAEPALVPTDPAPTVPEPSEIFTNSFGQQVLVWHNSADDETFGAIPRGNSRAFTFYALTDADGYTIGRVEGTAILLPQDHFTAANAGKYTTAYELEDSRLLEGTGLGGKAVVATHSMLLTNSISATSGLTIALGRTGTQGTEVTAQRGDRLVYRMTLTNGSEGDEYGELAFYNVLPAEGDVTALRRAARNSEWAPTLDFDSFEATLANTKLDAREYEIFFAKAVPQSTADWAGTSGFEWKAAASWDTETDGAPVAFKAVFGAAVLEKGKSLVLTWDMTVPDSLALEQRGTWAVNTAAFALAVRGLPFNNETAAVYATFRTETDQELKVSKENSYAGAPAGTEAETFHFRLHQKRGDSWRPVDLKANGNTIVDGVILDDGTFTITVGPNETVTATIKGLDEDDYYIEELDLDTANYTAWLEDDGAVRVEPQGTNTVNIKNTRVPRIDLLLQKVVKDDSGFARTGRFVLELQSLEASGWQKVDLNDWRGTLGSGVSVDDKGRLVVLADGVDGTQAFTAHIAGLPQGSYRLKEVEGDTAYWQADATEVDALDIPAYTEATLTITNTRRAVAQLALEKHIVNDTGKAIADTFTFQLQKLEGSSWQPVAIQAEMLEAGHVFELADGKLVLKATGAGSFRVNVRGLEDGTYRFEELESGEMFALTSWNENGTSLVQGDVLTFTIENTRLAPTSLKIEKVLEKNARSVDAAEVFSFKVQRKDGSGWVDVKLDELVLVDAEGVKLDATGLLTIELKPGESVEAVFEGLPAGTYRVEEIGVDETAYRVDYSADEVDVAQNSSGKVTVTNTPLEPTSLTIEKVLEKNARSVDAAETFSFKVQRKDGSGWVDVKLDELVLVDAEGVKLDATGLLTIELKPGESVEAVFEGLPAGTYRVEEIGVDETAYRVDYSADEVDVAQNGSGKVTVTNTPLEPTSLTIEKVLEKNARSVDAAEVFSFKLQRKEGSGWVDVKLDELVLVDAEGVKLDGTGLLTIELKPGESVEAVFEGLPAGTYRVEEIGVDETAYRVDYSADEVDVAQNGSGKVTVTNTPLEPTSLTIEKVLEKNARSVDAAETFSFKLQRKEGSGWVDVKLDELVLVDAEGVKLDGTGLLTIELKPGESVEAVFEGLPAGTYRVEEVGVDETAYRVDYSADEVDVAQNSSGKVTVTNTPLEPTSLTIEKVLEKNARSVDAAETFSFKVQRKDGSGWVDVKLDELVLVDAEGVKLDATGLLTIELKPGESVEAVFEGLPAGTYRVEEVGVDEVAYRVDYSADEVDVAQNGSGKVTVTNTPLEPTSLTIEKVLEKEAGAEDTTAQTFTFKVQKKNGESYSTINLQEYTVPAKEGVAVTPGGELTITLKPGESLDAVIEGLTAGTYRVVEKEDDRYEVEYAPQQIDIARNEKGTITVTNTPKDTDPPVGPGPSSSQGGEDGDSSTLPPTTTSRVDSSSVPESTTSRVESSSVPESTTSRVESSSVPESTTSRVDSSSKPESSTSRVDSSSVPESSTSRVDSSSKPESSTSRVESSSVPESTTSRVDSSSKPESSTSRVESSSVPESSTSRVESSSMPQSTTSRVDSSSKPESTTSRVESSSVPESTTSRVDSSSKPESSTSRVESSSVPESSTSRVDSSSKPESSTSRVESSSVPESTTSRVDSSSKPESSTSRVESSSVPESTTSRVDSSSKSESSTSRVESSSVPESTTSRVDSSSKPESSTSRVESSSVPESTTSRVDSSSKPESSTSRVDSSSVPESTTSRVDSSSKPESSTSRVESSSVPESTTSRVDSSSNPESSTSRVESSSVPESTTSRVDSSSKPESSTSRVESSSVPESTTSRVDSSSKPESSTSRVESSSVPESTTSRVDSSSKPESSTSRVESSSVPESTTSRVDSSSNPESSTSRVESSSEPESTTSRVDSSSKPESTTSRVDSSSKPESSTSRVDSSSVPESTTSRVDSSSKPESSTSRVDSSSVPESTTSRVDSSSKPESSTGRVDSSSTPGSTTQPVQSSSSAAVSSGVGQQSSSSVPSSSVVEGGGTSGPEETGGPDPDPVPSSSSSRPRASSSSVAVASSSSRPGSSSIVVSSSTSSSSSSVESAVSAPIPAGVTEPDGQGPGGNGGNGGNSIQPDENGGYGQPGDAEYIEPNGRVAVMGMDMPLGGLRTLGVWSLLNLIMSLLALLSGAIVFIHLLAVRNKPLKQEEEQQDGTQYVDEDEQDVPYNRRSTKRKLIAAIAGLLPLIFFLIVERFTMVVLITKWTPYVFLLFLLHFGLLALAGMKRKQKQEEEWEEQEV